MPLAAASPGPSHNTVKYPINNIGYSPGLQATLLASLQR